MTRRPRHLLRWSLGVLALLAVLAVAVPYLYIHVVQDDPPATLNAVGSATATSGTPADAAPAAGSVAGVWTVGAGSQAGYRVAEVLGGQDTTAVGRTDAVTGSLTVAGSAVTAGAFSVDLTKVASDSGRRDDQFRTRIMDTAAFPTATFQLTEPLQLGSLAHSAGTTTVRASGKLTLHGVAKQVTAPLTAVRAADGVRVSGQVPVVFADYGIDNPSIGGFVTTADSGVLEVLLVLRRTG